MSSVTNPVVVAAQISQQEGYARAARARLRDIEREALAGPSRAKLDRLKHDIAAAKQSYSDAVRATLKGNGAAMGEAEDNLKECRDKIRQLKREAKKAGVNITALGLALKLQRIDDYETRTELFDAVDQYAKLLRLWDAPGAGL